MGVKLTDLLVRKKISLPELSGNVLAVDASLWLHQFLSSIRQKDGSLLTDSNGEVTSHLMGLLTRSTHLMQNNIKLVYVFDGVAPLLKKKEIERRRALKKEAEQRFDDAKACKDIDSMKKYAGRLTKLNAEMILEAQKLLEALGIPHITAPSEGEAQAAFMVKQGDAYAVATQDADALLFGASRLVRNLSVSGRKKLPGQAVYQEIMPEIVWLDENLQNLGITREELIVLGILIGTDFNPGGIKGIGPVNALKLVKQYKGDFEKLFEMVHFDDHSSVPWESIYDTIKNIPVLEKYSLEWNIPKKEDIIEILCKKHDFAQNRIESIISKLEKNRKINEQGSLQKWF